MRLVNFLIDWFRHANGPVSMLLGGALSTLVIVYFLLPYYKAPEKIKTIANQIQETKEVNRVQTKKIERNKRRIETMRESLTAKIDRIYENQRVLICQNPEISGYWKRKNDC